MREALILLRNRRFSAFWIAQTLSGLGDAFRRLVITLWVFQVSGGSGSAIAVVTVVEILPYVLLSPLAGAVVDRLDRRTLLLYCDAARFILTLGLVFTGTSNNLVLGLIILGLMTVVSAFADLANNTVMPHLVEEHELERANALMNVSAQLAFALGPILAALSFERAGPVPAFALDSLSFAVSFLVLWLAIPDGALGRGDSSQSSNFKQLILDVQEGWKYIRKTPLVAGLFVVTLCCLVNAGINNTVMIFFLTEVLGRAAGDIAWLSTTNGVMQVIVGGILVTLAHRVSLLWGLIIGLSIMLIGALLITTSVSLAILVTGVLVTSLGNAPLNVASVTLEQRFVPKSLLGRVRGLAETSSTVVFLSAAGLAGGAVSSLGSRALLSVSAAMIMLALIVALVVVRPAVAQASSS